MVREAIPGKNLVLVGSMGSGKTSVGERLAARLGARFVDTDRLIERSAGMSVADIFTQRGERAFRVLERRTIHGVVAKWGQVIATGGGTVVDPINRTRLLRHGLTVWLQVRPEVAATRLAGVVDRPLLASGNTIDQLRSLLRQRESAYREAHLYVETSERSPEEVSEIILNNLHPAPSHVTVRAGTAAYDVDIGWGTLPRLADRLVSLRRTGNVAVVTNPRVGFLYAKPIVSGLRAAGFRPLMIRMPDGERYKTLRHAARVYDGLVRHRVERKDTLVALGGGVVGDVAGFVAATYLRGIAYVQVPTTLVSQVDSSIGGKTGVDHREGKNLIGAFHHPLLVFSDIATLQTLPPREIVSGLAEVVKYGMIADPAFFAYIEEHAAAIRKGVPGVLSEIVRRSAIIKAEIVGKDERESGLRKILNYGHTAGHVVETCTGYSRYRHGEAVAIGMDLAARLARSLGLCSEEVVTRQRVLLARLGLPVALPSIPAATAIRSMLLDKKVADGRIHFILPRDLGHVEVVPVETAAIRSAWR